MHGAPSFASCCHSHPRDAFDEFKTDERATHKAVTPTAHALPRSTTMMAASTVPVLDHPSALIEHGWPYPAEKDGAPLCLRFVTDDRCVFLLD